MLIIIALIAIVIAAVTMLLRPRGARITRIERHRQDIDEDSNA